MEKTNLPAPNWFKHSNLFNRQELEGLARRYWKSALFIGLALYLCLQKDITIDFMVSSPTQTESEFYDEPAEYNQAGAIPAMNVSMLERGKKPAVDDGNQAVFDNAPVKKKKTALTAEEKAKREKRLAYVKRYKDVAIKEMEKFGIPASITLAQGILESNMGQSKLATRNKNHFGIKCFSRKCRKGHCSNFTDDSHKDFFRVYPNVWDSYRAHSNLLQGKRYKHLRKLGTTNYREWAHGLKKAGYATDKRYAEKLINHIEDLELYQYDS